MDQATSPFPRPYPQEPVPRSATQAAAPSPPIYQSREQNSSQFSTQTMRVAEPITSSPNSVEKGKVQKPSFAWEKEDDGNLKQIIKLAIGIFIGLVIIVGILLFVFRDQTSNLPLPPQLEPSNLIDAQSGGTVINEAASIIIPPGALAENTGVKMEKIDTGEITDVYALLPEGIKFLKPVTVILPYKPEKIDQSVEVELTLPGQEGGDIPFILDKETKTLRAEVWEF